MNGHGTVVLQPESVEMNDGLITLNDVHSVATKLWAEKLIQTQPPAQRNIQKLRGGGRQQYHPRSRRITPVQLSSSERRDSLRAKTIEDPNTSSPSPIFGSRDIKSALFQNANGNGRNRNFAKHESLPDTANVDRKRAQIKSLPRKPPDIQNLDHFPPIGDVEIEPTEGKLKAAFKAHIKSISVNPFEATNDIPFDPEVERSRIMDGMVEVQTKFVSISHSNSTPPKVYTKAPGTPEHNSSEGETAEHTKSRSAELFSQITAEQYQELETLSENYSASLDSNLCRSLLAEFTFLCQLLVANNDSSVSTPNNSQASILASLAPRVRFVINIFERQLHVMASMSEDVIQMLIDFYQPRIPKTLRKKLESIICEKLEMRNSSQNYPNPNFFACVTYQSETDGRTNFPHQKDCQDFGKQRDLFYAIREIWISYPNNHSPTTNEKWNGYSCDLFPAKVRLLFQMNSSPTNLCRLASLFISQCILDLNSTSGDRYDPTSLENIQRILNSNPSKYEKLRQRLLETDSELEGRKAVSDQIEFVKYFVQYCPSEFGQHLCDQAINEIRKVESEVQCSAISDCIHLLRKAHLLAQILGYLHFRPYRDEEFKKPISPINVELYIQAQIRLRIHQVFPLNLFQLLFNSLKYRRLIFTLPWIIELLSRADQISFHLPSYQPVLNLISSIYRQLLIKSSISDWYYEISPENKNLLRFSCGKLFGHPHFPDVYLFGGNAKMTDYISREISGVSHTKPEDDLGHLDLNDAIAHNFLPIWFRDEMKQMIAILSTNATVRGSIPSQSPGLVKHIRDIPHIRQTGSDTKGKISSSNRNLQADLEYQFFQIQPSSFKKTTDFVSEKISHNFVKQFRTQILNDLRAQYSSEGIFGVNAVLKCKSDALNKFSEIGAPGCLDTINVLLGESASVPVRNMCQRICVRIASERIQEWIDQHVTKDSFPKLVTGNGDVISQKSLAASSALLPPLLECRKVFPIPFFMVLRSLHGSIKRLHAGFSIDMSLIDTLLEDSRLEKEKPWIIHRTVDLALTLITFIPSAFTSDREERFITFWKKVWTDHFNTFLSPQNLVLLMTNSPNHGLTFRCLSNLLESLLRMKLISIGDVAESCMVVLKEEWPSTTKIWISNLLQKVGPAIEGRSLDSEVVDWVAWYCSQRDESY